MIKIVIGVIVAAFVVITGFMILDPDVSVTNENTITERLDDTDKTTGKYSIEGEINKAGTYSFSDEVTMDELISAAGGLTSNADERSYYSTYILSPGKTYYIASFYDSTDLCNNNSIEKANVNEDDASTLLTINGITSSVASSIISYRNENGQFNCLEDLLEVYGIGNATYRKIRNFVILHE